MKRVFADTSFYAAVLNPQDRWHEEAVRQARAWPGGVVLTDFILLELGNALSSVRSRRLFVDFTRRLRANPKITIVPASRELIDAGLVRYEQRADKSWSLTDCISFVVMEDQGLTEALTADRHFEQAGFGVLLK